MGFCGKKQMRALLLLPWRDTGPSLRVIINHLYNLVERDDLKSFVLRSNAIFWLNPENLVFWCEALRHNPITQARFTCQEIKRCKWINEKKRGRTDRMLPWSFLINRDFLCFFFFRLQDAGSYRESCPKTKRSFSSQQNTVQCGILSVHEKTSHC